MPRLSQGLCFHPLRYKGDLRAGTLLFEPILISSIKLAD